MTTRPRVRRQPRCARARGGRHPGPPGPRHGGRSPAVSVTGHDSGSPAASRLLHRTARRPPPRRRWATAALSASQRTTLRPPRNGTIRSTPSSVSFCTTSSGLSRLGEGEGDGDRRLRPVHVDHVTLGRHGTVGSEPARHPATLRRRWPSAGPRLEATDPRRWWAVSDRQLGSADVVDHDVGGGAVGRPVADEPGHLKAVRSFEKKPRGPRCRPARRGATPADARAPPAPRRDRGGGRSPRGRGDHPGRSG